MFSSLSLTNVQYRLLHEGGLFYFVPIALNVLM